MPFLGPFLGRLAARGVEDSPLQVGRPDGRVQDALPAQDRQVPPLQQPGKASNDHFLYIKMLYETVPTK